MVKQSFKKAGLLLILYTLVIIGIFVIQFRNESLISNVSGLLRMSVSQMQTPEGETVLKNDFHVSFNGISFSADDAHPVRLTTADGNVHNLTLLSWEQASPLAYSFTFSEDTTLVFAITDTSSQASLSISAHLPSQAKSLSFTYKPTSGFSVTGQSSSKQTVSSKNVSYKMTAPIIDDNEITLTRTAAVAMYNYYDERAVFTVENVPADENAAAEYAGVVAQVHEKIVTLTEDALKENKVLTENVIAAYVAEMAATGRYEKAIATVPDSFKKGNKRTYITAPYFNTLVQMNPSLVMAGENMQSMVSNAVSQRLLDVFAVSNLADYMMRESTSASVQALVALPANFPEFQPTVSQATGIIKTYLQLAKAGSPFADSLSAVSKLCLDSIEKSCKQNGNLIILTEKNSAVNFLQTIETGQVLVRYGEYSDAEAYVNVGKILVASAFDQTPALDLRAVAELYPIFVDNNPNYPHTQLLGRYHGESVWAWTAATVLTYSEDAAGTKATITIDFPQGSSHYFIMNGIRPFTEIEIYGVPFRTDPRFESYNSSGYVYNERTHTLMIKSRQKAQVETIRLSFRQNTPPQSSGEQTEQKTTE